MQLGKNAMETFPVTNTLSMDMVETWVDSGEILYVVGWLIAIIMWGFALVWLFFAVASISRGKFPFNMGWWGFTFPLGVLATATTQMAKELPSTAFKVIGMVCFASFCLDNIANSKDLEIFSILVILLWALVGSITTKRVWDGKMLNAPCLKDLLVQPVEIELDDLESGAATPIG